MGWISFFRIGRICEWWKGVKGELVIRGWWSLHRGDSSLLTWGRWQATRQPAPRRRRATPGCRFNRHVSILGLFLCTFLSWQYTQYGLKRPPYNGHFRESRLFWDFLRPCLDFGKWRKATLPHHLSEFSPSKDDWVPGRPGLDFLRNLMAGHD